MRIPGSISATAGTAPKDGSELELNGNVSLRSEPRDGGKAVVIAAETLRFFPETLAAPNPIRRSASASATGTSRRVGSERS